MKLIDLDQQIFVPVVDETHGGAVVEMKMTVGEFFEKCCQGFEPEVVEAIPVEWLKNLRKDERATLDDVESIDWILAWWQQEQEAQDE